MQFSLIIVMFDLSFNGLQGAYRVDSIANILSLKRLVQALNMVVLCLQYFLGVILGDPQCLGLQILIQLALRCNDQFAIILHGLRLKLFVVLFNLILLLLHFFLLLL